MIKPENSEFIKLSDILETHREKGGDYNRRTIEAEQTLLKAQLMEKDELDARFAEIIAMIRETRQSIEQTIVRETEKKNNTANAQAPKGLQN